MILSMIFCDISVIFLSIAVILLTFKVYRMSYHFDKIIDELIKVHLILKESNGKDKE